MPKSKHAPALFELISKPAKGEGLRVRPPEPMDEPGQKGEPDAALRDDPPSPAQPLPERVWVADSPGPVHETPPRADTAEPWWRIFGGRIRFSLTQRGATIALAIAGLVLILAHYSGYSLGQKRGRAAALAGVAAPAAGAAEIESARRSPVTRRLFEGVGTDPTVTVPAAEAAVKSSAATATPAAAVDDPPGADWVQGHNYIVVQDFKKDARADAETAQEYLAQHGIPGVVLERSGSFPYRLITAQGFDLEDQAQKKMAEEYQDNVRRLGQAFLQAGGRYDFKTAYFIKLTGETW